MSNIKIRSWLNTAASKTAKKQASNKFISKYWSFGCLNVQSLDETKVNPELSKASSSCYTLNLSQLRNFSHLHSQQTVCELKMETERATSKKSQRNSKNVRRCFTTHTRRIKQEQLIQQIKISKKTIENKTEQVKKRKISSTISHQSKTSRGQKSCQKPLHFPKHKTFSLMKQKYLMVVAKGLESLDCKKEFIEAPKNIYDCLALKSIKRKSPVSCLRMNKRIEKAEQFKISPWDFERSPL